MQTHLFTVDGAHCTKGAYLNITNQFEGVIDYTSDQQIQNMLAMAIEDPKILSQIKGATDKEFSKSNPYTKRVLAQLNMKGPIYETEFVLNDKLTNNHPSATLDETVIRTLNQNEIIKMMNKFDFFLRANSTTVFNKSAN